MKKPEELSELLENLREEKFKSSVFGENSSNLVVYINDAELHLSFADSKLLLHSKATVDKFFKALSKPAEGSVEIYGMEIDDEVKEALEKHFSTVDEL